MFIALLKILIKGGDKMKKEWKKPKLEELNVNMTLASPTTGKFDGNFDENQDIPTNEVVLYSLNWEKLSS